MMKGVVTIFHQHCCYQNEEGSGLDFELQKKFANISFVNSAVSLSFPFLYFFFLGIRERRSHIQERCCYRVITGRNQSELPANHV